MRIFSGRKLRAGRDSVSARDYNNMTDSVNQLTKSLSSAGISDAAGVHTRRLLPSVIEEMFIAEVDSDATGGGYYNCHLQKLDATDWNTDTADQLDDTGDSVVVLNLAEIGTNVHNLDAGDILFGHETYDDEGTKIRLGFPVSNQIGSSRRAKTTSAWTTGTTTGANLLDADGDEVTSGYGFGITVNFFKTYSATNFPTIANDETIPVYKDVDGSWYCPYTFTDIDDIFDICPLG